MSALFSRRVISPLLSAALVWLLLTATAGAQGSGGTTLDLSLPSEGGVGQEMTLEARLADESGAAVAGVEVVFEWEAAFMNSYSELVLGRAVTDETGVAILSYVPRSEGATLITARFDGDGRHGPASSSGAVTIQTGPALYSEEAGVRVPGINVSLIIGILLTVWGVYTVVMVRIWLIARDGSLAAPAQEVSHE